MSLVEILVALAMSTGVGLAGSSLISYGYGQYNRLLGQNAAEQSLLLSAYYLRSYFSHAVNTTCMGSSAAPIAIPPGPVTLGVAPMPGPALNPPGGTPSTVPPGAVDCRPGLVPGPGWVVGQTNPLAIFNRENGGVPAGPSVGMNIDSSFQGVGIYFSPPQGLAPGVLYFTTGTNAVASNGGISLSNLVNVQIQPNTLIASPLNDGLESFTLDVKARYFVGTTGSQFFDYYAAPGLAPPTIAPYRDIDILIPISLLDNSLGNSLVSGTTTSERLNGGIYYFRFVAPMSQLM